MADDTDFPARVSLTTNKNNAYIFKEYREATWIASMLDMEVVTCVQKETETQPGTRKEV